AEGFLWTVRTHLHLTAGRALEQLTFDMQVEVARVLGYEDRDGRLAVELFMQDYFSHAREVGELTRVFLTGLEAQHVKAKPSLRARLFSALSFSEPEVGEGFVVRNGRLDYESADCIKEDPIWIFRLFKTGLETGYLIHPDAMRLLRANLDLVEGPLRNDPRAAEAFLSLMLEYHDPERALRRMNELGVLGAYIPEFGRIVAMMQFNMYHHYTVDEHTIRCIAELAYIEASQLESELPLVSEVLRKGVNRRVLYVALLLHDIGKGLPEDHSDVGARLAQDIAPRLGLSEDEVETVVWLVQNHLVMSDVAQKRDISDVRTVSEFAKIVESPSRLKLLTVLTVCDIRGVGPNVWNNWKAMLLRGLYRQTIAHLTGQVHGSRPERVETAKEALVDALEGWPPPLIDAELERHYDAFWLGLDTDTHAMFARMMTQIKPDEPVSAIDHDPSRDATRALFVMPDHPGIFSRMSGALALVGANVVEARIYTSSDGIATAAFWIQDREGVSYEKARLTRLRSTIKKTLRGEVLAREALKDKDREKKRERDFVVPTEITFDNDGSDIYTIIEVDTRDRPGLLFDLTRTLTANNISIASAIIATYGKQAVDSFYVKDLFGLKIHAPQKQAHLADRLRAAIQEGFERAGG
ncbi:MAG: [protein-PII] uridylyltransferase, partial [Pseudomonadota bacterium]